MPAVLRGQVLAVGWMEQLGQFAVSIQKKGRILQEESSLESPPDCISRQKTIAWDLMRRPRQTKMHDSAAEITRKMKNLRFSPKSTWVWDSIPCRKSLALQVYRTWSSVKHRMEYQIYCHGRLIYCTKPYMILWDTTSLIQKERWNIRGIVSQSLLVARSFRKHHSQGTSKPSQHQKSGHRGLAKQIEDSQTHLLNVHEPQ